MFVYCKLYIKRRSRYVTGIERVEEHGFIFKSTVGIRNVKQHVSYGLQFTEIDFLNYSSKENTFGLGNILTKQDICFLRNTSLRELALDQLKL